MRKTRSILRRVALLGMALYGVVTTLILVSQLVIGERLNLIAFFNTFAHLLWLPALFLLPLALLLRSGLTSGLLMPAVLAFIVTFGGHFIPKISPTVAANQTTFTVATYNLYDDRRPMDEIFAVIEALDVDVIAFQELSSFAAERLGQHFAQIYPYQAFHPGVRMFEGAGLISKYPITADRFWQYEWMTASLGHQRVELDIQGYGLTLYNLHPVHPGSQGHFFDPTVRGQEVKALMEETHRETGPLMLVGDFNLPELSDDYHRITQEYGFVDAYRVQGWGLGHTFTRGGAVPFLRLDYIFLGRGVDVVDMQVWPDGGGSDHRPVVGRFTLQ